MTTQNTLAPILDTYTLPNGKRLDYLPSGEYQLTPEKLPKIKKGRDILDILAPVTSDDPIRFILTGVFIDPKGVAVGSDGRILASIPYAGPLAKGETYSTGKKMKLRPETPKLAKGDKIDGTFPYWRIVVPDFDGKKTTMLALCERSQGLIFKAAEINRKCIVKDREQYHGARINVQAHTPQGPAFYDPKLLWRVINALRESGYTQMFLETVAPEVPAIVHTENPDAFGVIMPIRGTEHTSFVKL